MTDPAAPARLWTITEMARMLVSSNALASIKTQDAIVLAQRMRLCPITAGTVLFKAGATNTDFMALVLEGEAVVENIEAGAGDGIVLSVVHAGDLIGEMGVVANVPRSATVTASSDMMMAILEQTAFAQLIQQRPDVACGFLSCLLHSVTNRLRESNRKLLTMTKINQSMYDELEASKQNESNLAELFISATSFGTTSDNDHTAYSPKPGESQPPRFTQTYPI